MNHHDEEITDVIVVLDEKGAMAIRSACQALKDAGLNIGDVKEEEGVVEGSIVAERVTTLKLVNGVAYVRSVFTYTADYPVGDPRDRDGAEGPVEGDDD